MMGYGYDGGGWMWGFGGLMMLGALVLIGLGAWAVVTATNRPQHFAAGPGAPVLGDASRGRARQVPDQERNARGEMNTDNHANRL